MKRAWAIGILGLVLSGCGIGAGGGPQVVSRSAVPFGLLAPASTTTVVAPPNENVTIYLAGQDRLVTVNRTVPAPATIAAALASLGRGATTAESTDGLESPISTAAPILLRSVEDHTATVSLPASFTNLAGQEQIIAVAQLVYTVTAFPNVPQVDIRVGGQPATVPTADGSLSRGPLTRSDYAPLAPL